MLYWPERSGLGLAELIAPEGPSRDDQPEILVEPRGRRAAVACTPHTGPSTCRSSSTAGICETRRSSWVNVASMAARGSSMNTLARRVLQHCRVEASGSHLAARRWGVARGTTPPPTWLARTLLLSRGMRSWHDRAALSFMETAPVVCMHISDAVASGPPPLSPLRSEEPGCRGLVSS